jgi:hypothetical protein
MKDQNSPNKGTILNLVTSTRPLSVILNSGITGSARKERAIKGFSSVHPISLIVRFRRLNPSLKIPGGKIV